MLILVICQLLLGERLILLVRHCLSQARKSERVSDLKSNEIVRIENNF